MNAHEINDALAALSEKSVMLEDAFIEGGGEVTDQTESLEEDITVLKDLLLGDGVDSLGRWLRAKENQKASLKDEKAKIDRMIKATDRTIDYVKRLVDMVLEKCGEKKVSGLLYSFARSVSVTHTPDKELIGERYLQAATEAARAAGLPSYINISLNPLWSLVPEGTKTDEFITSTVNTITFKKPSKSKENESE